MRHIISSAPVEERSETETEPRGEQSQLVKRDWGLFTRHQQLSHGALGLFRSVCVCLSLPPSFSLYHHLSPNVSGGVQDLIWTVESAFRQNIFSPVLLPIMSKDILPNGSHINTTPLCTSPELNECYVTDVPQTRTQSAKTQPIALARGPVSK
ncbi:hypothetical protein E5288_WYG018126 [Bos mutus]|uniref:Uncharacterized protein n=1 Tax=Bos mutus TaxID=72004 RepID=A0A6B0RGM6_9CETA|nr:hypothetical protein [Bos mutus]